MDALVFLSLMKHYLFLPSLIFLLVACELSAVVLYRASTSVGGAGSSYDASTVTIQQADYLSGPTASHFGSTGVGLNRLWNSESWSGSASGGGFDMSAGDQTNYADVVSSFSSGYQEISFTAYSGTAMNLTSLDFAIARGGASQTRGYVLYVSVDGAPFDAAAYLDRVDDLPTTALRSAPLPVSIDLSGDEYQGISSVKFRFYPMSPQAGYTVGYDALTLNGTTEGEPESVDDLLLLDMVHHNPGDTPYNSAYNDPAVLKEMGYNGKVYFLFESPMLAITWETVDADILPPGTDDRAWVDAKAAEILAYHADCKANGMKIYAQSDLILFPKRLIDLYDIGDVFGDATNETVQMLLRAQINEMFDQFPDLDGLVVRIGETYLDDAPYHRGSIEDKTDAEGTIIPLMSILREEICENRGKTLIFRTWRSFDDNATRYQTVSDAIEPHDKLFISVKHCEGDFFRTHNFSRVLGMGRHKQIVEVQAAREYEGKGSYPNYVANGVIERFEEDLSKSGTQSVREFVESYPQLYGGVWTWTRGGGWYGPYIKDEMWCDLNAWVTVQWAMDTTQSEESVFERYALERLGLAESEVEDFRTLCLLSADAVLRGRYTLLGGVSDIWTRDQGIGFPGTSTDASDQAQNLADKDEAIEIWETIVGLAESIEWPDDATREHAIASSKYGLHLYEIYRSLIYLADADADGDEVGTREWMREYDEAWARYDLLPELYDSVASLYTKDYSLYIRDRADGIVETMRDGYTHSHWEFDDGSGSSAVDSSGDGNDGTLIGASWTSGVVGSGSLDFNGGVDQVTIPSAAFSNVDTEFSVAMWVYGSEEQPRNDTVFSATDGSGNRVLNIHIPWGNSRVYWDAGNSGGTVYDRVDQLAEEWQIKGKWNHWVFTKNASSGEMKIYCNGSLWHTGTDKFRTMAGISNATISSSLGFDGMIDDVRIYSMELAAATVEALYVANREPYLQWADQYGMDADTRLLTADPDLDGKNNLLEYALGYDPVQAESNATSLITINDTEEPQEGIEFSYKRRRNAAELGLSYTAEIINDLAADSWASDALTEVSAVMLDVGFEEVTTRAPYAEQVFFRLNIVSAD